MIGLPTNRAPTHPGEMLNEEFLKPLSIKQKDAADDLGISLVRLNENIKGKRGVTPDTALRLARRFGMSAEFWLGLQADWDLYNALRSSEASAINKIRLHPELAAV
jgi:addiction module HigA family antidote